MHGVTLLFGFEKVLVKSLILMTLMAALHRRLALQYQLHLCDQEKHVEGFFLNAVLMVEMYCLDSALKQNVLLVPRKVFRQSGVSCYFLLLPKHNTILSVDYLQ